MTLRDAGLRLLRYRQPPFVGRQHERSLLWAVLRDVVHTGRARVVVLQGPAGAGKSHLAAWVAERAREVGLTSVRADPAERVGGRPLVWVADDAPTSPGLLARVVSVLEEQAPVLVLITARAGTAADAALDAVRDRADCVDIPVEPLTAAEHRDLIQGLLPLSPELLARVVECTEGDPGYAVELVTDLAARGVLVPTPTGYRTSAPLGLPADLASLWAQRLDDALRGCSPAAIELAWLVGLLGDHASDPVLVAVCADLGLDEDPSALEQLVVADLLNRDSTGWRVEGQRARAAYRAAVDPARRAALHRACARALAATDAPAWDVASHHDACGELALALDALLDGVQAADDQADEPLSAALAAEAERLVQRLNLPETDPRRLRAAGLRPR